MHYYELIQFLIKESLERGIKPTILVLDKLTRKEFFKDSMINIQHLDGSFVYSSKEIEDILEKKEIKLITLSGIDLSIEQSDEIESFNKIHIELK